jgi:uncharacterized small protein (DUF1192 family)
MMQLPPDRLGGYYLNSLRNWRNEIACELRVGDRRAETLHRIGSSCAADHDAAMKVRRDMLAVVDSALAEHQTRDCQDRAGGAETMTMTATEHLQSRREMEAEIARLRAELAASQTCVAVLKAEVTRLTAPVTDDGLVEVWL